MIGINLNKQGQFSIKGTKHFNSVSAIGSYEIINGKPVIQKLEIEIDRDTMNCGLTIESNKVTGYWGRNESFAIKNDRWLVYFGLYTDPPNIKVDFNQKVVNIKLQPVKITQ